MTKRWIALTGACLVLMAVLAVGAWAVLRAGDAGKSGAAPAPSAASPGKAVDLASAEASAEPTVRPVETAARAEETEAPTVDSEAGTSHSPGGSVQQAGKLPLLEAVKQELGKLQEPPTDMAAWLGAMEAQYSGPADEPVEALRTDLDHDGADNEWVSVIADTIRDANTGYVAQIKSYGVVITYKEGKFAMQSVPFGGSDLSKVKVEAVKDLTGDGKPEVVWVSSDHGAHTAFGTYTVSTWKDGKLARVPGSAEIASMTRTEVRDGKLLLTGGLIDSVGAGPWQREFTETYAIVGGGLQRTDRTYADSPTPYHRLMDGLWAEALGHSERALQDYAKAAAMKNADYKGYAFTFDSEWTEGGAKTEKEAEFELTVRHFAQLRKELLARVSQGESRADACSHAKTKAGYRKEWLPYLNAPAGYANPQWDENTVCSGIIELSRF